MRKHRLAYFKILSKLCSCFILIVVSSCVSSSGIQKWNNTFFERSENNPIIHPEMVGLEGIIGKNINGPSVIKVPNWVENPLGKYYMYFAHHHGKYIRMAYADDPTGPWVVYKPGVLHLDKTSAVGHIASPDVIIDDETKAIRMYFHGPTPNKGGQKTFFSTSKDGLKFTASDAILGPSYFRVFKFEGYHYALVSGTFYRSLNGISPFEKGVEILPKIRHSAVAVAEDNLVIFYSQKGDAPERILKTVISLKGTWNDWKINIPEEVLKPERAYEGAELPIQKSVNGYAKTRLHELRDPAILIDDNEVYLYYSVAGESGIGVAKRIRKN